MNETRIRNLRSFLERLLDIAKCPESASGEDVASAIRRALRDDIEAASQAMPDPALSTCLSYAAEKRDAQVKMFVAGDREGARLLDIEIRVAHEIYKRIVAAKASEACDHKWKPRTLFEPKECERCGVVVA